MAVFQLSKGIISVKAWRCSQTDQFRHHNEVRSDGMAARITVRMSARTIVRMIAGLMMERLLTVL